MSRGTAVIGDGRVALIHARHVEAHPKLTLRSVVGRDEAVAQVCASQFGSHVTGSVNLSDVLADASIEAVVICSAPELHYEHISQALTAGKSVFTEHPVALTEEQIEDLFQTAEAKGLTLFCGYRRRFDPHAMATKSVVEKSLGEVRLLRITSREHPPPPEEYLSTQSADSALFGSLSVHDVDFARWMTMEEPETIYATASAFMGVEDAAVIVLKFPSGALCVIDNSLQTSYGYDVRAEVLGAHGMATLRNPLTSQVVLSTHQGHSTSPAPYSLVERYEAAHCAEMQHWVEMMEGTTKPRGLTKDDCVSVSRIINTIRESHSRQLAVQAAPSSITASDAPYPTVEEGATIGAIIFGTGRMGRVRAEALRTEHNVKVLYGFDIIEASAQAFAADFQCQGGVLSDEALGKALQDPQVKVVFVSTTSNSHCKLITAALQAGKHVFCEKPLALTAADTQQCVQLAEEKGLALYCGFHRRSDVHFQQLREAIKGVKQLIRVTSREPSSNSGMAYLLASGGFLFDSVIHDIDMAIYLTEEYPYEVYCQAHAFNPTLKEAGDVDAIVLVLRFPSGCIVTIDNYRHAEYGYDQRAEVHTSQGMYSVDNLGYTSVQVGDGRGFTTDNPPDCLARYKDAYANETKHFVALLQGREKLPRSPMKDYTITARIAEAARVSMVEGKAVPFNASE